MADKSKESASYIYLVMLLILSLICYFSYAFTKTAILESNVNSLINNDIIRFIVQKTIDKLINLNLKLSYKQLLYLLFIEVRLINFFTQYIYIIFLIMLVAHTETKIKKEYYKFYRKININPRKYHSYKRMRIIPIMILFGYLLSTIQLGQLKEVMFVLCILISHVYIKSVIRLNESPI